MYMYLWSPRKLPTQTKVIIYHRQSNGTPAQHAQLLLMAITITRGCFPPHTTYLHLYEYTQRQSFKSPTKWLHVRCTTPFAITWHSFRKQILVALSLFVQIVYGVIELHTATSRLQRKQIKQIGGSYKVMLNYQSGVSCTSTTWSNTALCSVINNLHSGEGSTRRHIPNIKYLTQAWISVQNV